MRVLHVSDRRTENVKEKCKHRRLNIIVVTGRSGKKVRECLDCGELVRVRS